MKKRIKKSVLLLGTVCLCFLGLLCIKPTVEVQADPVSIYSAADLISYCGKRGSYELKLGSNITLNEGQIVTIAESCTITLDGNGKSIIQNYAGNTFEIRGGGKLTVSNLTVDRSATYPNANVFRVEAGGSLVVNGGTYKTGSGADGVGSSVIHAYGNVTITGGTFYGAKADFYAVGLLGNNCNYTISGGTFTQSTSGMGVNLYAYPSNTAKNSVTISGGNFCDNKNNGITIGDPGSSQLGTTTATINGGNFYNNDLNGVSVCFANQTCNVKAANIYNNKQAGVLLKGSKVNFTSTNAGTLKVYNNGKYNVGVFEGGEFNGGYADLCNTAYMDNRGIIVYGATATVGAGTTIKNSLDGIYVDSSGTAVVNGGFIGGCERGIWVYGSTCTINNVEINGNTTGIDADSASTLTMSAGKIVNNKTGLYVEGTGKATLAGSSAGAIVIAGNSSEGIKVSHSATFSGAHLALLAP